MSLTRDSSAKTRTNYSLSASLHNIMQLRLPRKPEVAYYCITNTNLGKRWSNRQSGRRPDRGGRMGRPAYDYSDNLHPNMGQEQFPIPTVHETVQISDNPVIIVRDLNGVMHPTQDKSEQQVGGTADLATASKTWRQDTSLVNLQRYRHLLTMDYSHHTYTFNIHILVDQNVIQFISGRSIMIRQAD